MTTVILRNRNSQSSDTNNIKLNRLSTSSSLSIITPPTTPKRPVGGRLKMALSISLAHNFNQKLANLNDKWNDFSFMLKSNAVKGTTRNDSYHSIESAVTCTAADLEAGNLSGGGGAGGGAFDEEEEHERRSRRRHRKADGGGNSGLWNSSGASSSHRQSQQKPYERHKTSRLSPRRNSASGDPKEFDMLVLKTTENLEDNESF